MRYRLPALLALWTRSGWVSGRRTAAQAATCAVALAPDHLQRRSLIMRLLTQAVDPIARCFQAA